MAFPVPSHLPRKSTLHDVSTQMLARIDEATYGTLTASFAASWLTELDETILATKEKLHDRIKADLPSFELQLDSAKSIQTRLRSLTDNARALDEAVSDSQAGLIPTLVRALSQHATLSQESSDAALTNETFSNLLRYKAQFSSLRLLVHAGQLAEAARACETLRPLLDEPPPPLNESRVLADFKQKFRVAKDYIEEQLNDAYSRSFVLTPTEITIRSPVEVRKSDQRIAFSAILSTLSTASLSSHLTIFRRDLTSWYIDRILAQPTSISISSPIHTLDMQEHTLTPFPSPPTTETSSSRLENLSAVLTFLDTHMFPCLPEVQKQLMSRSIYKPIATGVLNHLLIPSLPSSFAFLSPFLDLVRDAVDFENKHVKMFGDAAVERIIKTWADGVGGHYERKRRMDILEKGRWIVTHAEDNNATFSVEVELEPEVHSVPERTSADAEQASGFDGGAGADVDESGWGFDEDVDNQDNSHEKTEAPVPTNRDNNTAVDEDPAAAWGWNDEDSSAVPDDVDDGSAWDDPWDDTPADEGVPIVPVSPAKPPLNGTNPPLSVDAAAKIVPPPTPSKSKETYLVSSYVKQLMKTVEDVLEEGKEFASSGIVAPNPSSSSSPGFLILQSAISVLDLFRALYPVNFASLLVAPERAMRFSNDCLYLSGQMALFLKQTQHLPDVSQKLVECKENLRVLGDSRFDDAIECQRREIDEILLTCQGFTGTTEQDRYDECESAISRVLRHVRYVAQRWKGVLTASKYYIALGLVVDAALSRMLEDILALPDITADESHKLSELCRIFNSLEGLFFVNLNDPSPVAAYVPSWLKFSYLSELLEASIADISYLFEIGALVDFEVDELVSLVRALFADTPLRASTINKLLGK